MCSLSIQMKCNTFVNDSLHFTVWSTKATCIIYTQKYESPFVNVNYTIYNSTFFMLCIIRPGPSRKISVEQRVIITVMTSGGRITWHTSYRERGDVIHYNNFIQHTAPNILTYSKTLTRNTDNLFYSRWIFFKSKTTILQQCPILSPKK